MISPIIIHISILVSLHFDESFISKTFTMKLKWHFLLLAGLILSNFQSYAESGGPLHPLQAAYNVQYYHLDLSIDPVSKTIDGSLLCKVEVLNSIDTLYLDLDDPFNISSILLKINDGAFAEASFTHANEKLFIMITEAVIEGDVISCQIFYNGAPRIADDPPWGVGFVWETTDAGNPWLAVACEDQGGDIWWPCKDHPSDEPDSMNISLTVPNPLTCVSNGQYLGSEDNGDNTSTFHWFVSTPINNYNVTFYAAEYNLIEDTYLSTNGESIPFYFWVLPENYDQALAYMDVFHDEFNFLEQICGPFPYGTDKHGWAHAPYWGMEHQTIIAYGHDFTQNNWGYDYIHYHELAHEWWGNHLTAKDWADVWIHEGVATYTEALFVDHFSGTDSYIQYMKNRRPNDYHQQALAPREELTADEGFNLNPYSRGAAVMHTFRYHLGDDDFFELLKRWNYPDPNDLDNTHGRQSRMVTTDDLKVEAEDLLSLDLTGFFEAFFREASYPDLNVLREQNQTSFTWETENGIPLDVNIPILINDEEYTVEMIDGQGSIAMNINDELDIDPDQWILMSEPSIIVSVNDELLNYSTNYLQQNYPNPFNDQTIIKFSLAEDQFAKLSILDLSGKELKMIANNRFNAGIHEFSIETDEFKEGIYFYRLKSENFTQTKQFVIIK